MNYEILN